MSYIQHFLLGGIYGCHRNERAVPYHSYGLEVCPTRTNIGRNLCHVHFAVHRLHDTPTLHDQSSQVDILHQRTLSSF